MPGASSMTMSPAHLVSRTSSCRCCSACARAYHYRNEPSEGWEERTAIQKRSSSALHCRASHLPNLWMNLGSSKCRLKATLVNVALPTVAPGSFEPEKEARVGVVAVEVDALQSAEEDKGSVASTMTVDRGRCCLLLNHFFISRLQKLVVDERRARWSCSTNR